MDFNSPGRKSTPWVADRLPPRLRDSPSSHQIDAMLRSAESMAAANASHLLRFKQNRIGALPGPILSAIFSLISDPRTRNCMALVCSDWYSLERATRLSLCLRGNIYDLHLVPRCFVTVETLDLSHCSPWGYSLFQSTPGGLLIGQLLKLNFPRTRHLTVYVRDARDIEMVAFLWPELESIRLVRWHKRALQPEEAVGVGMELHFLLRNCKQLKNIDLSKFYCWTEDIPPAIQAAPVVSNNLRSLNLLKISTEGFKTAELTVITGACRNLEELFMICVFDPRILDFIGEEGLLLLANNCRKLRVLHLIDDNAFGDPRGIPSDGFAQQDSQITPRGLQAVFRSLTSLEDLAFVLSQNLNEAGPALYALAAHCKCLRSLRLGHFHGVCNGRQPDGVALCSGLRELNIRNCPDLTDMGLVAIARGCSRLSRLGLRSCKEVSAVGLRACAQHLSGTLVDVEVSCCLLLDATSTLWALRPVQLSIQRLHIDCVWNKDTVKEEDPKGEGCCREWRVNSMASTAGEKSSCFSVGSGKGKSDIENDIFDISPTALSSQGWLNGAQGTCLSEIEDGSGATDGLDLRLSLSRESVETKSETKQAEGFVDDGSNSRTSWEYHDKNKKVTGNINELGSLIALGCGTDFNMEISSVPDSNCGSIHLADSNRLQEFGKQDVNVVCPNEIPSFIMDEDSRSYTNQSEALNGLSGNMSWKFRRNVDSYLKISVADTAASSSTPVNSKFEHAGKTPNPSIYAGELQAGLGLEDDLSLKICQSSYSCDKPWSRLQFLSLWMPVGEMMAPLPVMGLQSCPSLTEVTIRVEGDCRLCSKPRIRNCGLSKLAYYPALSKLSLDCSEAVGFALSAPEGHMDLSLWERWYLSGIQMLKISELDYWPPQDKEMNRRGLSLPGVGLLSLCANLRKLIIHGTAHEHFMQMLLQIPDLRDVQFRTDYYPAPEDDLSTEMRTDSCKRFEAALGKHHFSD